MKREMEDVFAYVIGLGAAVTMLIVEVLVSFRAISSTH